MAIENPYKKLREQEHRAFQIARMYQMGVPKNIFEEVEELYYQSMEALPFPSLERVERKVYINGLMPEH